MEDKIKSAISETLDKYSNEEDPMKRGHLANAVQTLVNALYTLASINKG